MSIYKRPDSPYWWMSFTVNGKTYQKSTKTKNKKQALKVFCKVEALIDDGKFNKVDESKKRTFQELAAKYESQVFRELKGFEKSQSYLNQLRDFFGSYKLAEIQAPLIDDFKQMRKAKGVSKATINRQLNILKRMLNIAKKRWHWLQVMPDIEMEPKADRKRKRFLTFKEYHELLDHCEEWLRPIVALAAWTGLRQGNVINLRREQVELSMKTITIDGDEMKNEEDLCIPVSKPAYDTLKAAMKLVHLKSSFIFCDKEGQPFHQRRVQKAFKGAVKDAGIENFRFHDLRHCYASWNRQAGASLDDIAELLGQKDTRMAKRYSHITIHHLSKAVESVENFYDENFTFSLRSNKKGFS